MDVFRQDVKPDMHVRVQDCGGDLRIVGYDDAVFEARGDEAISAALQQTDDGYTINNYGSDLQIMVPHEATVELRNIGGDVDVRAVAELGAQSLAGLEADDIGGDVHVAQVPTMRIGSVGGDLLIEGDAREVELGDIGGDLNVMSARSLTMAAVGGDVRVGQVQTLQVESVGGDLLVEGEGAAVELGRIGGDLRLKQARSLSLKAVGGDASLDRIEQLHALGRIGGDLRLSWNGRAEGEIRGTVGGDASIELGEANNLTIIAVVGGDVRGQGDGWNVRHEAGRHQLVFGDGTTRLVLTIGGDLHLKGRVAPQHVSGSGDWSEMRGSMDAFGEEMRGLGRELEELGRTLARDLSGLGRDLAREVRIASRDSVRDAGKAYVSSRLRGRRGSVRDGFNLDPDQIDRIKREARSAAASGIARAQEAVEQALQQVQQGLNTPGRPSAPRAPTPPTPPAPPSAPYTGQTRHMRPEDAADHTSAAQAQAPANRDAERLAILRMVHEGRLSPDEAEMLLRGLDDAA